MKLLSHTPEFPLTNKQTINPTLDWDSQFNSSIRIIIKTQYKTKQTKKNFSTNYFRRINPSD